jgi:hypothetical protein
MTDEDVDLEEEFDPIGSASDLMKIVFIFDNELEAETFMSFSFYLFMRAKPSKTYSMYIYRIPKEEISEWYLRLDRL